MANRQRSTRAPSSFRKASCDLAQETAQAALMRAPGRIVRQQPVPRAPVVLRPVLDYGGDFHEEGFHLELRACLGVAVGAQRPALHDAENTRLFPRFLKGHLLGGAAALEAALGDNQPLAATRRHHADASATYRDRRRLANQ